MRHPTPIVTQAGERFLHRLKNRDPALYSAIVSRMPSGMAGMGDLWGSILDAVSGAIKSAPSIMQSEWEAKRRMEAAEQMAEEELERARLKIRQQEIAAQALQSQADMIYAQQMLEQERANLIAAQNSMLTAGQKTGLGVAGALTIVLLALIYNRKRKGR